MSDVRLVTYEMQGRAWTRCEEHYPEQVRAYLDCEHWPGWISTVELIDRRGQAGRCVSCRAEELRLALGTSKERRMS